MTTFTLKMTHKDSGEASSPLGKLEDMHSIAQDYMKDWYIDSIEPSTFVELSAEIDRLETLLADAELSLVNSPWESGDLWRKVIDEYRLSIAALTNEINEAAQ